MAIGEKVKVAGDRTATLTEARKRTNGPEKVYNFEVWREHNYFVGKEGVLVHNSYLKDAFKAFLITNIDNLLIHGKKWTHKARKTDTHNDPPDIEEIRISEIIGEHRQENICLAPKAEAGFDAVSESGTIMSYKGMQGTTAHSNLEALQRNITEARASYKKVHDKLPEELKENYKCEIWISGKHASGSSILQKWETIKPGLPNPMSDFPVSKIFYIGPDNNIYELLF